MTKTEKAVTAAVIITCVAAVGIIPVTLYSAEIKNALQSYFEMLTTHVNVSVWALLIFCIFVSGITALALRLFDFLRDGRRINPAGNAEDNASPTLRVVSFDYLPRTPWETEWQWAKNYEMPSIAANLPKCSPAADSGGGITIKTNIRYAIDYFVSDETKEKCKGLRFSAKFKAETDTMFFTEVEMATADNSKPLVAWIKHYDGTKPSKKQPEFGEWVRWMAGKKLKHGWVNYEISLADAVKETWGQEGWQFRALRTVRIRGNISMSPIELTG